MLANLVQGHLRKKVGPLQPALEGHFTDHHQLHLKLLREFVEFGEQQLSPLDSEVQLLINKVQGEPGLSGPADGTVAGAEASPPQATSPYKRRRVLGHTGYRSTGGYHAGCRNWGQYGSVFPMRVTWLAGRGFVREIMRARESAARQRPKWEASGSGVPFAKRRGPPRTRKNTYLASPYRDLIVKGKKRALSS